MNLFDLQKEFFIISSDNLNSINTKLYTRNNLITNKCSIKETGKISDQSYGDYSTDSKWIITTGGEMIIYGIESDEIKNDHTNSWIDKNERRLLKSNLF